MKTKELKMKLLNSEELNSLSGGAGCTKIGNVIFKECVGNIKDFTVVLCATYEASCSQRFSNTCGVGDINCPVEFIVRPK